MYIANNLNRTEIEQIMSQCWSGKFGRAVRARKCCTNCAMLISTSNLRIFVWSTHDKLLCWVTALLQSIKNLRERHEVFDFKSQKDFRIVGIFELPVHTWSLYWYHMLVVVKAALVPGNRYCANDRFLWCVREFTGCLPLDRVQRIFIPHQYGHRRRFNLHTHIPVPIYESPPGNSPRCSVCIKT